MHIVDDILRTKGAAALAIDAVGTVDEALRMMGENNVGSLLVTHDQRLVGLFTERDFVKTVARDGASVLGKHVGDVITGDVLYVSRETALDHCMALMTDKRTRHLPVLENGEVAGILSIGDIVKALIDDKDFVIAQLERYIAGR